MATKNVTESDLSGKLDASTIAFGLGSKWYEIDLTKEEEAQLQSFLKTYIKAGRETGRAVKRQTKHVVEMTATERNTVRQWGRENGFEIPPKGRVPKAVVMAYDKAHGINREIPFT